MDRKFWNSNGTEGIIHKECMLESALRKNHAKALHKINSQKFSINPIRKKNISKLPLGLMID